MDIGRGWSCFLRMGMGMGMEEEHEDGGIFLRIEMFFVFSLVFGNMFDNSMPKKTKSFSRRFSTGF